MLTAVDSIQGHDCVILLDVVPQDVITLDFNPKEFFAVTPALVHHKDIPRGIVYAKAPSVLTDIADPRNTFYDTAKKAVAMAKANGATRPVLLVHNQPILDRKGKPHSDFKHHVESALLGALQEIYTPLQAKHFSASLQAIPQIAVKFTSPADKSILEYVSAVEQGKILARDMGGADPEFMSPLNCASHILEVFKEHPHISVSIEKDPDVLLKEYPLLHAVARCSLVVPRHHPVVVKLVYKSENQAAVKENLFLVGKGVTYDTGGADV